MHKPESQTVSLRPRRWVRPGSRDLAVMWFASSNGGDTVVCTQDADLVPGASFSISLTTTSGDPGRAVNTVVVAGAPDQTDENLVNNSDTATVSVGELPHTGFETRDVLLAGLLLLLLGGILVLLADRKSRRAAAAK